MHPPWKIIRRRWFFIPVSLIVVATAAVIGLIEWAGDQLASPPRRALMDYHHEYLSDPGAHGLRIDPFTASDGTPCLVCTPAGRAGARGLLIRKQLAERGFVLAPFGTITGNLVLLHGRKGRKDDYLPIAERLCAAGFRCILPDLPAHGDHPVKTITYGVREAGLPARVLEDAAGRFGFDKQPCGLLGMSMGGSVAVHAAAQAEAPWKSLVVIASFDSLLPAIEGQAALRVGGTIAPLWVEAAGKVYERKTGLALAAVQPRQFAPNVLIPTLMAHGTKDNITLISSGRKLYDSLPLSIEKQWIEIPGAGHDNVLITDFPIYATIAEWMIRHLQQP